MRIFSVFILIVFSIYFSSCTKDKALQVKDQTSQLDQTGCDTISFSATIQPIFTTNCATSNCHNNTTAANGFSFDSHGGITTPTGERLLGAIKHETGFSAMPKFGNKLSQQDIGYIECWVNNGRPNN